MSVDPRPSHSTCTLRYRTWVEARVQFPRANAEAICKISFLVRGGTNACHIDRWRSPYTDGFGPSTQLLVLPKATEAQDSNDTNGGCQCSAAASPPVPVTAVRTASLPSIQAASTSQGQEHIRLQVIIPQMCQLIRSIQRRKQVRYDYDRVAALHRCLAATRRHHAPCPTHDAVR